MNIKKFLVGTAAGVLMLGATIVPAFAASFFNGFETDISGWETPTRVASGANGITSAAGSWHAEESGTGDFTRWGGYNYGAGNAVPTTFQEYSTSVDVYLDINGNWANNTRFDFTSAINNSAGTHLSDFIFNAGFYNDATGPGADTNRFVVSASTNSQPGSAYAKNPDKDPIAISTSGWYTFEHHFYDNAGTLNVDMSIYDASHNLVKTWTLVSAPISGVGGNRYGWFDFNEFSTLAFDNSKMETAPVLVGPPTNKDQCKKDGWMTFNNPTFKNQGQCVSYVEKHSKDNHDNNNDNHDNNNHGNNGNHGDKGNHGKSND